MKIKKGLVDIIIPAYNPGPNLIEAIKSCLSQSYINIRITVIDDSSTEDIQKMLKIFPPIINYLRTEKNSGPAGARNHGIKNTDGEYISFLDSDDIMDKDKIRYSIEEFKKNKEVGMTCGNYCMFINGKIRSPFYKTEPVINHNTLMKTNYVASGSVTVRRIAFESIGGFNEEYWIAEDYDAWIRLSELYIIKYLHRVLYLYRIVPGGDSLTQRKDIQSKHIVNIEKIKNESKQRVALRNDNKDRKTDT